MDCEEENVQLDRLRITMCEVCAKNEPKYTCPRCELRTCCLDCINIHKKELECSGLRDKVKFKKMKDFDNIDLLNDYRMLEEMARVVGQSGKLPPKSCYNERSGTLPTDLYRLKCTAQARGIQLNFFPPSFSRRCSNTSFLDHETQSLYWRVDWVFPQAGNITLTDEHVLDSTVLSACLHKYIDPESKANSSLSFYQAAGQPGIKLLLKAERSAPNRYFLLDPTSTLRDNLNGKSIIENPVIYVVLNHHIDMCNVFTEEEEEDIRRRQRRRQYLQKRNTKLKNNFLFSQTNDKEDNESESVLDNLETISNVSCDEEDGNDFDRPTHNRRHNFSNHRRGRGRHNFRNKWNTNRGNRGMNRRGFGRRGFSSRNDSDFSEQINTGLSTNLSDVNLQS